MFDHGRLYLQREFVIHPFDGFDASAVDSGGGIDAGIHHFAFDQHGTCPAFTFAAALFGAG
jgi:hypothetical protein